MAVLLRTVAVGAKAALAAALKDFNDGDPFRERLKVINQSMHLTPMIRLKVVMSHYQSLRPGVYAHFLGSATAVRSRRYIPDGSILCINTAIRHHMPSVIAHTTG
jgi:hypothetical protein